MIAWDALRPPVIMLVEDSPTDILLVREALVDCDRPVHLVVFNDGVTALDYLRLAGLAKETPMPDLILLDMNLPRLSGLDVLSTVRADDRLCRLPVVMLSTSTANADVSAAYS